MLRRIHLGLKRAATAGFVGAASLAAGPVVSAGSLPAPTTTTAVWSTVAAPRPFPIEVLSPSDRTRMTPSVWRKGCPVGLDELRKVTVTFRPLSPRGTVVAGAADRIGVLIVHQDVAVSVAKVFAVLYQLGYPVRQIRPIEAYGGSDFKSIEADNTSAFNCRAVTGGTSWSEHAYGRAIDLNPLENPYVDSSGHTAHAGSVPYLNRTIARPGVVIEGDGVTRVFDAIGWGWGGRWSGIRDYQHFSASGR